MRPQKCLFIKYPKPNSDRPYKSKPRFGRDVFTGILLAVFFLVLAWAGIVFIYGLVAP